MGDSDFDKHEVSVKEIWKNGITYHLPLSARCLLRAQGEGAGDGDQ